MAMLMVILIVIQIKLVQCVMFILNGIGDGGTGANNCRPGPSGERWHFHGCTLHYFTGPTVHAPLAYCTSQLEYFHSICSPATRINAVQWHAGGRARVGSKDRAVVLDLGRCGHNRPYLTAPIYRPHAIYK